MLLFSYLCGVDKLDRSDHARSHLYGYRTVLQRVRWRNAGIEDALLLMPQAQRGGTLKSPASQGEAVAALRDGKLTTSWHSSYGLSLDIHSG